MTGQGGAPISGSAEADPFDRSTSGEGGAVDSVVVDLGADSEAPATDIGTTWDDKPAPRPFLPAFDGLDGLLLASTVALLVFGVMMVMTASAHYALLLEGNAWSYGIKQGVGIALGLFGAAVVLVMPYRWLQAGAFGYWVAAVIALGLVQSPLGHAAKGAPRWISLGAFNLQPSEMAKVCLALVLARHFHLNAGRMRDVFGVVLPALVFYVTPLVFLTILQSDLGQVVLLFGITIVALFVAGLDLIWMAQVFAIVGMFGVVAIGSSEYRRARITGYLDPIASAAGDGMQVVQGWVAIAVGGVGGTGFGNGVAQQGFLPEAHTDMILAVVAEETGIFGWCFVVLMQFLILWRGMLIAQRAEGMFEMVAASCLTSYLAAQVIINVGVIGGLMPAKGLVLPFMSYGASAVIFNVIAVGILARIGLETRRQERQVRVQHEILHGVPGGESCSVAR
jgi:cell division protein FtsW